MIVAAALIIGLAAGACITGAAFLLDAKRMLDNGVYCFGGDLYRVQKFKKIQVDECELVIEEESPPAPSDADKPELN